MKRLLFGLRSGFRRTVLVLFHLGLIALSLLAAILLRYDFDLTKEASGLFQKCIWIAIVVKIVVFLLSRLHRGWWRFVGINDLLRVFFANVVASAGFTVAV